MEQSQKNYLEKNQERFLEELMALLRIPSVSTKTEHKRDMDVCAQRIREFLLNSGCDHAQVISTEGHPVVYGEKILSDDRAIVLVYGHYDVQPADEPEQWQSALFSPVIRDGKIFTRGAADDKGQFHMHLKALEVMLQTGGLKHNVKFLIEGEEEIGSPSLRNFLKEHGDLLRADLVLISDNEMMGMETPSLEAGFRGASVLAVEVTGPVRDLHSGTYGGGVANPILILSKMLASLHDENNHVTIPGFYDRVRVFSAEERKMLANVPFNEEEFKRGLGIRETWGEAGYTPLERTLI